MGGVMFHVEHGEGWSMRIVSWNVNGLRAILAKNFAESIQFLDPDILCLQEIKVEPSQLPGSDFLQFLPFKYFHSAERLGYSGTAIFSKVPWKVFCAAPAMGGEGHKIFHLETPDLLINPQEGRIQVLDCDNGGAGGFFLVNVYTPNANGGAELKRLRFRYEVWDPAFCNFLEALRERKPVIICGDFNVAHQEIDLAHPECNYQAAGFTDEEREGFSHYIDRGFVDIFRKFYPQKPHCYTWWSYRMASRRRNIGWRIDYFLASQTVASEIKNIKIYADIMGSDHAPIAIEL